MKYAASLCLLALATLPRSAQGAVIWRGDFESGDLSQWQGVTNEKKGDRVNIAVVEDVVAEGSKACRFEIHGDDDFSNTQSRTQVTRRTDRTGEGDDVYMAKYVRMPEDAKFRNQIQYWESDGYKNNVDFWVEPKEGGGTTINFGTGLLGKDKHWRADLTLNQWHLIAHHIHWSQNAAEGSITVWFDGKVVVDAVKLATKPDNQALFTQLGFHRAQRSELVDVIYLDGVIEADSEADLLALPVPMGAAGGSGGAGGMGGAGGSLGGGGGAPGAGIGGVAGAGPQPMTGGVATGGAPMQAGAAGMPASAGAAPNPPAAGDDASCAFKPIHGATRDAVATLLLGALLVLRRGRPRVAS